MGRCSPLRYHTKISSRRLLHTLYSQLELNVHEANLEALAFYKALGFSTERQREMTIKAEAADFVVINCRRHIR